MGSWQVTHEWARRYLEAVGDDRPEYLEAGMAPPLGLTARALGTLLERLALPPGAIHSAQELEVLAPVQWGEVISATASIDGPKRRGGLEFITASYSLEDGSGRAVLKGKSTVLNIDPAAVSSVGRESSTPPTEEQTVPASGGLPAVTKVITQDRLRAYAQASGDSNPLHLDPDFAATTQFGSIIAHGMLTLAYVAQMMVAAFGRSWLETGTIRARFKGAAYLGDEVETRGQVTKEEPISSGRLVACSVGLRNRRSGQELISASATVRRT